MTESRRFRIAVALLTGWAVVGCARYQIWGSRVEENFGRAQHENVDRMVADPGAEWNVRAVTGLDPATVQQVLSKYRRAQTAAPQPTGPSIINIGTGPR